MNSREKGKRGEAWESIPGYEGLYEVSTHGNIRSLKRYTTPGKVLKQYISTQNGYCYVSLSKNNKKITKRVHKLVMMAFDPVYTGNMYNKDFTINHKNGDKADNRLDNLEWLTQSENQKHAFKNGLQKITWNRPVIRVDDGKIFTSATEAVKAVGGRKAASICRVCSGERKHYKGYKWKYYKEVANDK